MQWSGNSICFFSPLTVLLNVCRTIWGYSFVPKQEYRICHIGWAHWSINVILSLPLAPDDTWSTGERELHTHTHTHSQSIVQCDTWGERLSWSEWLYTNVIHIQRCLNRKETTCGENPFRQVLPSEIVLSVFLLTFNYNSGIKQSHSRNIKMTSYKNLHISAFSLVKA